MVKSISELLGERLRSRREAADLSREALSLRCGLSPGTLLRIETGKHWPREPNLVAIARALNFDPTDLLSEVIYKDHPLVSAFETAEPDDQQAACLILGVSYSDLKTGSAE